MTPARKEALSKFMHRRWAVPKCEGIRQDVARALFNTGHLAVWTPGDKFRAGYAALTLTESGRLALSSHKSGN